MAGEAEGKEETEEQVIASESGAVSEKEENQPVTEKHTEEVVVVPESSAKEGEEAGATVQMEVVQTEEVQQTVDY
ncbi:hypothetical protein ABTM37_21110, partial [Acinetobacter baumannii]